MTHEMRRKLQQLPDSEVQAIFNRATSGVLALIDEDDCPYAVPLSFVQMGENLYFHWALQGHKVSAMQHCSRASFCVIDKDTIVPEKYTTYYRSAVAFGTLRVVEEEATCFAVMQKLAEKYRPQGTAEQHQAEIDSSKGRFLVVELTVNRRTGKAAKEL